MRHTVYPYLLRGLSIERPNQVFRGPLLYDELRAIEQQIAQLVDHIRRAAGKAIEKVKELVRGPQPEPAAPSAEPPKAERPKPGGDRGADDTWMPGDGFLGRGH